MSMVLGTSVVAEVSDPGPPPLEAVLANQEDRAVPRASGPRRHREGTQRERELTVRIPLSGGLVLFACLN